MDNKKKEILKSLKGSASTKIDLNKVKNEWKYKDIFNSDCSEDECEWDIIREICQNAIKRKDYTIEQVKENCERILEEIREERYCTVAESLEQSLKEVKLMREGKIPKKTINEVLEEIENE